MGFDRTADDGEAETGAFDGLPVVLVPAEEALKDEGNVVGGNADAVVTDGENALVLYPAPSESEGEVAARIFFDGVFEQIGEDLVPVEAVAIEGAAVWREGEFKVNGAPFEHGGKVVDGVLDAGADIEGFDVEIGAGGLESGNGEHVLDDADEAVAVLVHDGEAVAGGGGLVDKTILQGLDVALNDGEGGAQFVRGVGDEVFADLLGEHLLGDVVNHEPSTAFGLGRERGGLDQKMAADGAAAAVAGEEADLADAAAAFTEGEANGLDDLVIVNFIQERAEALDGGPTKELGDGLVGEADVKISIDDEYALPDLAQERLEQASQVLLPGKLGALCGEFLNEGGDFIQRRRLTERALRGGEALLPEPLPVPSTDADSAE